LVMEAALEAACASPEPEGWNPGKRMAIKVAAKAWKRLARQ
jgi:hypothetical protein